MDIIFYTVNYFLIKLINKYLTENKFFYNILDAFVIFDKNKK